jgi:hypothetical protein
MTGGVDRIIGLLARRRYPEAEAMARGVLTDSPGNAAVHDALGVSLYFQGRLAEAVQAFREALSLDPGRAPAWYNLGTSLSDLGQTRDAVDAYRAALAGDPNHHSAAYNLARALLLLGEWDEGWQLYEARGRKPNPLYASLPYERWTGAPPGRYVLALSTEQGMGDAIQFARYVGFLRRKGYEVVLLTDAKLVELMRWVSDVAQVATGNARIEGVPVKWSPLMSVPAIVGTTPTRNIPPAPYMRAEPARAARWAERLGPDGFKVGIVWQGNPSHARDRTRSLPLAALVALADVAGARLISLQKGFGAEQIATVPFRDRIEALADSADVSAAALLDHAALIAGLDLVITVDTMLAHLAGALGRPVWLLLEHLPDWRWLTARPDTPWYPSMRLFRQRTPGAWAPVMQEVVSALRDVVRR